MIRMLAAAALLASPLPVLLGLDHAAPGHDAAGPQTVGTAQNPVMLGRMVVTATPLP